MTYFHGFLAIETTPEVWAVMRARHHDDMAVFSSFSDPTGTAAGGTGDHGSMETSYGLIGSDYPLIGARTTWVINQEKPAERIDEKHYYWLIVPRKNADER